MNEELRKQILKLDIYTMQEACRYMTERETNKPFIPETDKLPLDTYRKLEKVVEALDEMEVNSKSQ